MAYFKFQNSNFLDSIEIKFESDPFTMNDPHKYINGGAVVFTVTFDVSFVAVLQFIRYINVL